MSKSTLSPEVLRKKDVLRLKLQISDRAQPSEPGEIMGLLLALTYATKVEAYGG